MNNKRHPSYLPQELFQDLGTQLDVKMKIGNLKLEITRVLPGTMHQD